ncbi:MAG: pyrimidine reductase family protein [Nocardioidaceae bacterium]
MQAIYPTSPTSLTDDDIAELYAYPVERPWVRANFVSTLDGAVQGHDERSGSISDVADRRVFTILRSLCDVVLVGAGTARAEGYAPVLTGEIDGALRQGHGLTAVPSIAVVSQRLDVPDELLRGGEAPTLVLTSATAPPARLEAARALAEVIIAGDRAIEPAAVVEELSTRGYQRTLLEGGPQLMCCFVAAGRCDELCLTTRSLLVGGDRHRMLRSGAVSPPAAMHLRHVLEDEGTLFSRYTRTGG